MEQKSYKSGEKSNSLGKKPGKMSIASDIATEDSFMLVAFSEDDAARRIQHVYRMHAATISNKVEKDAARCIQHLYRKHATTLDKIIEKKVQSDAKSSWIWIPVSTVITVMLVLHEPAVSAASPLLLAPPLPEYDKGHWALISLADHDEARPEGNVVPWASALIALLASFALVLADENAMKSPMQRGPSLHVTLERRQVSTQTVRTNACGRPIDARGRFLSFAQARALGWNGVVSASRKKRCKK